MLKTTEHFGDVSGVYDNLEIGYGVVGADEIADGSVTEYELGSMGANTGQVLRYNGTRWGPANDGISFFETSRSNVVPNNADPAHKLMPFGAESNIDFVIQPKGNGSIIAGMPDNLRWGGEKRGQFAVDLQLERGVANQVAKGAYSALMGGDRNRITGSGQNGFIGAGSRNLLNGMYGAIVAGQYDTISGSYSFIGAGTYNSINSPYSFIGGGSTNTIDSSYGSLPGGSRNKIRAPYASIAGGDTNVVSTSGKFSNISGGILNVTNNWYSNVSGGALNNALGEGSSVIGGVDMKLDVNARNSFGFNGNKVEFVGSATPPGNYYTKGITISQPRTGVLNNVDLWLTNNDDTVRTLRFYERYNQVGAFPNGSNYVALKAPNSIASDVTYTLPSSAPTSDGQMLVANASGTMSWGASIVKLSNLSIDPPEIDSNGGSYSLAVTVTGAKVGGTVQVSPRAELETGIIIAYARVTAIDTVSIRFVNSRSSKVNPAAVNVDISVIQP